MRDLGEYLGDLRIGLVDVGARGGLEPRWRQIERNIKAFLFEPDERSRRDLVSIGYVEEIFPIGLGSIENTGTINLCQDPGVSSLLMPRHTFLSQFPNPKRFDVVANESINVSTLDKCLVARDDECDFIKIDTQGTELDILKGGESLLDSPIIGLEIEVEFIQLYEAQPLFGDVCSYLGGKGYEFFDFVNICRWEREKFSLFGQAVFGDGLFLRPPETFRKILSDIPKDKARQKAKKYIAIVALYGHIDLLPICIDNYCEFLKTEDLKAVKCLYRSLLRRQSMVGFMLRVINLILRPLGIQTIGLQKG